MKTLTKCPPGKKSRATHFHAQHLASPHVASVVLTLPSPRHVKGGHRLQTGIASRFPAHVAHACPEKPRKQPSEVAAVAGTADFISHMGRHVSTLLSYLINCAATQCFKLATTRGSKRGDIRPLKLVKLAAGLPPMFPHAGTTPLVVRIRASKLLPTLRYIS